VRNRVADAGITLLLFGCGIIVAWNFYAVLKMLPFPAGTSPSWRTWLPLALGCVAAFSAGALYFTRRLAGIIGSIALLMLAILFIPRTINERLTLLWWDHKSIEFPGYIAPAVLSATAILVCWRFVFTSRATEHTM